MAPRIISIIGGLDADLIMVTDRVPERGESLLANTYHEALGGKGATQQLQHIGPVTGDHLKARALQKHQESQQCRQQMRTSTPP